jgi:hypothetical protein
LLMLSQSCEVTLTGLGSTMRAYLLTIPNSTT